MKKNGPKNNKFLAGLKQAWGVVSDLGWWRINVTAWFALSFLVLSVGILVGMLIHWLDVLERFGTLAGVSHALEYSLLPLSRVLVKPCLIVPSCALALQMVVLIIRGRIASNKLAALGIAILGYLCLVYFVTLQLDSQKFS